MIWNRHYDMRYFDLFLICYSLMAMLHFDMIRRTYTLKWWEISYPLACVQTEHHFSCHIKNESMTVDKNNGKTKAKNNGHFFALKVNFWTMSILAKKLSNFYHFKKDRRFLKKNIEKPDLRRFKAIQTILGRFNSGFLSHYPYILRISITILITFNT